MQARAEALIGRVLRLTFPLYFVGALYVVGPVLGWLLAAMVAASWRHLRLHPLVLVWIACMFVMQTALVLAHINLELPLMSLIKSSIGWAKGWALLALFIAAGALLRTPDVLYRGACHIGIVALGITPVLLVSSVAGLPEALFVSPLKILGGSGPEFFEVRLFEHDPGFGVARLRYFAPWAPAIGIVANILLLLALQEANPKWRLVGSLGCLVMILLSLSRLGWLVALFVPVSLFFLKHIRAPSLWFAAAPLIFLLGFAMPALLEAGTQLFDALMNARSDSTLVRGWLKQIALQRWQSEAPILGHGVVEVGPHLVQFMPIGSHHTWLGLLFVKGLVGVLALAVPMLTTTVYLLLRSAVSDHARAAFGIMLVLSLYTFGENLEILAYLIWPGLLLVGFALSETRTSK